MTKSEQQRRVRAYEARKSVHEGKQRRLRRDNVIAIVAVVVVATLAALGQWWHVAARDAQSAEASASSSPTSEPVPDPSLAEGRSWTGDLTVNGIELGIELDGAAAPQAVSSFVSDTERGYYNDKTCHRLTTAEGFGVLQCGSLDGSGGSDPDYSYGPIENAPADDVYPAGTIAMARVSNDAESNGHQFFIVYEDTTIPSDNAGGYSVIGTITSGLDELIDGIVSLGTADGSTDGAPAQTVTIDSVTVE